MQFIRAGFTLIECMVYCCILGYLVVVGIPPLLQLTNHVVALQYRACKIMEFYAATDVWYRDMTDIQAHPRLVEFQGDAIILLNATTNIHIGWLINQDSLFRREGAYDTENKTWKKWAQSLVCRDLKRAQFDVKKQDGLAKIQIHLEAPGVCIERAVCI